MLSDTALRPGTKKTRPRCVFVLTLVLSACGTTASIEDETLDAGESGQSDGGVDAPPADPIDRQGVDASGDATLTSIVEGGSGQSDAGGLNDDTISVARRTVVVFSPLGNDDVPLNMPLEFRVVEAPLYGTALATRTVRFAQALSYAPDWANPRSDSFVYTVRIGARELGRARVHVNLIDERWVPWFGGLARVRQELVEPVPAAAEPGQFWTRVVDGDANSVLVGARQRGGNSEAWAYRNQALARVEGPSGAPVNLQHSAPDNSGFSGWFDGVTGPRPLRFDPAAGVTILSAPEVSHRHRAQRATSAFGEILASGVEQSASFTGLDATLLFSPGVASSAQGASSSSVVGWALVESGKRAFVRTGELTQTLLPSGAVEASLADIDEQGRAVGEITEVDGERVGWLRDVGGRDEALRLDFANAVQLNGLRACRRGAWQLPGRRRIRARAVACPSC